MRKVSADSFFLLLLILNNEILNPVSGTSLLPAVNHAFYSLEGNAKALTLGGKANFFPRALTFTSPSLGKGDFCFQNLTKIFRNTVIAQAHLNFLKRKFLSSLVLILCSGKNLCTNKCVRPLPSLLMIVPKGENAYVSNFDISPHSSCQCAGQKIILSS